MSMRLVILGLSTFSRSLVENIAANGEAEIIVVEHDEERLSPILPLIDRPVVGDATHRELLEQLDVKEADIVIVTLGTIEASLLALLYLRELEARNVTVKALSREHVRLLELLQADNVIFPEKQMADFFAVHLLHPDVVGAKALSDEVSIVGLRATAKLEGRSVGDLEDGHDVVIAIVARGVEHKTWKPQPDTLLQAGDLLMVFGANADLVRFEKSWSETGPHGKLVPWW